MDNRLIFRYRMMERVRKPGESLAAEWIAVTSGSHP